jgi:hypothetical protein
MDLPLINFQTPIIEVLENLERGIEAIRTGTIIDQDFRRPF